MPLQRIAARLDIFPAFPSRAHYREAGIRHGLDEFRGLIVIAACKFGGQTSFLFIGDVACIIEDMVKIAGQ